MIRGHSGPALVGKLTMITHTEMHAYIRNIHLSLGSSIPNRSAKRIVLSLRLCRPARKSFIDVITKGPQTLMNVNDPLRDNIAYILHVILICPIVMHAESVAYPERVLRVRVLEHTPRPKLQQLIINDNVFANSMPNKGPPLFVSCKADQQHPPHFSYRIRLVQR